MYTFEINHEDIIGAGEGGRGVTERRARFFRGVGCGCRILSEDQLSYLILSGERSEWAQILRRFCYVKPEMVDLGHIVLPCGYL